MASAKNSMKANQQLLKIVTFIFMQCIIDISRGILRVGTTGTETNFLSDSEVKEMASVYQQEEVCHVAMTTINLY